MGGGNEFFEYWGFYLGCFTKLLDQMFGQLLLPGVGPSGRLGMEQERIAKLLGLLACLNPVDPLNGPAHDEGDDRMTESRHVGGCEDFLRLIPASVLFLEAVKLTVVDGVVDEALQRVVLAPGGIAKVGVAPNVCSRDRN